MFSGPLNHNSVRLPKIQLRSRHSTGVRWDSRSFRSHRNSIIVGSPKCLSGSAHSIIYDGVTEGERLLGISASPRVEDRWNTASGVAEYHHRSVVGLLGYRFRGRCTYHHHHMDLQEEDIFIARGRTSFNNTICSVAVPHVFCVRAGQERSKLLRSYFHDLGQQTDLGNIVYPLLPETQSRFFLE